MERGRGELGRGHEFVPISGSSPRNGNFEARAFSPRGGRDAERFRPQRAVGVIERESEAYRSPRLCGISYHATLEARVQPGRPQLQSFPVDGSGLGSVQTLHRGLFVSELQVGSSDDQTSVLSQRIHFGQPITNER